MTEWSLVIKASNASYEVHVSPGLLARAGTLIGEACGEGIQKGLLVTDKNVFACHGEVFLRSLEEAGWQLTPFVLSPGERSKSIKSLERLYSTAIDAGLDRSSPVIAFGGGVVGDLAGFAAATYLRGVPLVMVPTTLLAQVDSSVGGKVAVNHPRGKNLIGAIYPPHLVLADPQTLESLPRRELHSGLAEVIKYAVILDPNLFVFLEKNLPALLKRDTISISRAVAASIRAKAAVVEADEFEKDYRRVLNFGHTFGHALEAATAYRYYRHGEAVLVGMALAADLALLLGMVERVFVNRIKGLIAGVGLKKPPPGLTAAVVIDKLRQDKKRRREEIIFVLPTAPGRVTITPVNGEELLADVVRTYLDV